MPSNQDINKVEKSFKNCVKECTNGASEVIKMHKKHSEVSRLTYSRNIIKCLEIHAHGATKNNLRDEIESQAG